jgi:hypothetical protein
MVKLTATSFVPFSMPAVTQYQAYQSKVRRSALCEAASQFNDGSKDMSVQSEEITYADATMMCRNGEDDTLFEDMLDACRRKNFVALKTLIPRSKSSATAETGSGSSGKDSSLTACF